MFGERVQILISRDQRRRLKAEAKRRHTSVGAVIREAIDGRVGGAPSEARSRAVAEIRAMSGGRFVPPGELERIVDQEREAAVGQMARRRR